MIKVTFKKVYCVIIYSSFVYNSKRQWCEQKIMNSCVRAVNKVLINSFITLRENLSEIYANNYFADVKPFYMFTEAWESYRVSARVGFLRRDVIKLVERSGWSLSTLLCSYTWSSSQQSQRSTQLTGVFQYPIANLLQACNGLKWNILLLVTVSKEYHRIIVFWCFGYMGCEPREYDDEILRLKARIACVSAVLVYRVFQTTCPASVALK